MGFAVRSQCIADALKLKWLVRPRRNVRMLLVQCVESIRTAAFGNGRYQGPPPTSVQRFGQGIDSAVRYEKVVVRDDEVGVPINMWQNIVETTGVLAFPV